MKYRELLKEMEYQDFLLVLELVLLEVNWRSLNLAKKNDVSC
jgi:hypothetical protein